MKVGTTTKYAVDMAYHYQSITLPYYRSTPGTANVHMSKALGVN